MNTGIYKITCLVNSRYYIGSASKNLHKRLLSHKRELRAGTHRNRHLQRAWNKYGQDQFVFTVLETCPPEKCLVREQFWIDQHGSADPRFGFNLTPTAGSQLGLKHSTESKKRHSAAAKKRLSDPVYREKLSSAARERFKDPEQRKVISDKLKGRPLSDKTRARMSAAHKKRYEDPAQRLLTSEKTKRQWADPKIRAKMLARNQANGG